MNFFTKWMAEKRQVEMYLTKREIALTVAWRYLGKWYLWGGDNPQGFDCCFPINTPILTPKGFIPIQDMKRGSDVFTYKDGTLIKGKVINLFKNSIQDIYEIKTRNSHLKVSGNHPFLKIWKEGKAGWNVRKKAKLIWRQCKDLKRKDFVVALTKYPFENTLNFSDEFIWFLGAFMGDGHTDSNKHLTLAFFDNELREKAVLKISKFTKNKLTFHPTHGIYFTDVKIVEKLVSLGLNKKSFEREIPSCVWGMSKSQIEQFLEGYIDADGYRFFREKKNYGGIHFACSSQKLMNELQLLLRFFEGRTESVQLQKRTKDIYIKGKKVKNAKDLYRFSWYPQSKRNNERTLNLKNYKQLLGLNDVFGVERILSVEKAGQEPTYNLETNEGTFIAENFVVHNSGFVIECLKSAGVLPAKGDWKAVQLWYKFASKHLVHEPRAGCLVFFRKLTDPSQKIVHVEMCLDSELSIGAMGGGSCIKTIADAFAHDAFIKIRKFGEKGTLVVHGFVDPFMDSS